ncbi:GNAT family N-acetyltransferase [Neobacillus sp. WH10]|uniref:GNAT family N-acetyltransferase n=1 Tax=Neobacillus sp. WH10 TaxID=3047873 RepID=UPI0024C14109|nr:GNAT family N-acetyltransferase [Neobacillus sp. WH10]WHY78087.1 GNAT family N-acetyltransferase [Neobacillus sp. WH10]
MNMKLTDRMLRIINNAESETAHANSRVLTPVHLLIACLQEKTGALGEIRLRCNIDLDRLRADFKEKVDVQQEKNPIFTIPISIEVHKVMEAAICYMNRYNQVYLNEGHLLKALLASEEIDRFLTSEDKKTMVTLGTTARDMITHLRDYTFPNSSSPLVRKVKKEDYAQLVRFVAENFSTEWANTVKDGLISEEPTIYIAHGTDGNIIGFAAFDVYLRKKGYFGPMGVAMSNRTKGIGYELLHHCLKDMKEIGYEYAIIGGAGPIEFYEEACNAVVIPAN